MRISFGLSYCLGFANHICQTNKLQTAHTLHCTLDTVYNEPYRPELSTPETSTERTYMRNAFVTNEQAVSEFYLR